MSCVFLRESFNRQKIVSFLRGLLSPLGILLPGLAACTYSFSNLDFHPPTNVRSIAIAGIYDTSRRIIPHALLWESLQREIIKSGKIALREPSQADVYLKTHLLEATIADGDERRIPEKKRLSFAEPDSDDLSKPYSFEDLKTAERFSVSHSLGLTVAVEIWDLRSKRCLLNKRYFAQAGRGAWNEKIPKELRFIRSQESLDYMFADASDEIARQVLVDFYSLP